MSGRLGNATPEIGSAARRMVRALLRRAANGDTDALHELRGLDLYTTQAVSDALRQMHDDADMSWAQLAAVTGTSRQACAQRAAAGGGGKVGS